MKGVMSNSRGKETYVVIFRRSFAECSNLWGGREGGRRETIREEENRKNGEWWGGRFGNNRYYRFITENTAREERKPTFCSLIYTFIMRS